MEFQCDLLKRKNQVKEKPIKGRGVSVLASFQSRQHLSRKKNPHRQNGVPEVWVDDFAVCLHWAVSGLAAALVRKNHQQDMAGLQDPKGFDGITCQ